MKSEVREKGKKNKGKGIGSRLKTLPCLVASVLLLLSSVIPLNLMASSLADEFYKEGLFYVASDKIRDEKDEGAIFLKAESFFFLSDYSRAYQHYSFLKDCSLDSEKLPIIYYKIGDCLWFMDKKEKAISAYNEALSKFPNYPSSSYAIFRIIQYYLEIKDYDKAVSLFSSYLMDYPDTPWKDSVFYLLADTFEETREYNRAILYYKKILEQSRDDKLRENSLFSLARLYYEKNELEKSLSYANELVWLYPSEKAFIL
ncbi:MAG: tetratricopeptide repeat protein, partial [bacterium]